MNSNGGEDSRVSLGNTHSRLKVRGAVPGADGQNVLHSRHPCPVYDLRLLRMELRVVEVTMAVYETQRLISASLRQGRLQGKTPAPANRLPGWQPRSCLAK